MKYIFYTLFYLPFLILFYILSPILVLFREETFGYVNNNKDQAVEPRLVHFLSWAMTPDNSLWGDDGWKKKNPNYKSYWSMVKWLYRNPCYGLATTLLALPVTSGVISWPTTGYEYYTSGKIWQLKGTLDLRFKVLKYNFGWMLDARRLTAMYLLSIRLKSKD